MDPYYTAAASAPYSRPRRARSWINTVEAPFRDGASARQKTQCAGENDVLTRACAGGPGPILGRRGAGGHLHGRARHAGGQQHRGGALRRHRRDRAWAGGQPAARALRQVGARQRNWRGPWQTLAEWATQDHLSLPLCAYVLPMALFEQCSPCIQWKENGWGEIGNL